MPSIYLYVSKGKIDQLSEQNLGLLSKVTAKIQQFQIQKVANNTDKSNQIKVKLKI